MYKESLLKTYEDIILIFIILVAYYTFYVTTALFLLTSEIK